MIATYADLLASVALLRAPLPGAPPLKVAAHLVPRLRHLYAPLTDRERTALSLTPQGMELGASILLGVHVRTVRAAAHTVPPVDFDAASLRRYLAALEAVPTPSQLELLLGCPRGYETAMARALHLPMTLRPTHTSPVAVAFLEATVYGNSDPFMP